MPSTVAEFKAIALREFTLPHSKLTVAVQMIDCADFMGVGELPIPATPADLGEAANGGEPQESLHAGLQRLHRTLAYADRAIAMGAVNPPFSQQPQDKGRTDVVHVTDLSMPDRMFLGNAILEMIGLNAEWAEQVHSFREDPERPAGAGAGGALPQAAA